MNIPDNRFKAAIRRGEPQIGLWSSLCSENAADIIATAGFDWVLVDMEHSVNDPAGVVRQLRAYSGTATHPVVRPPSNEPVIVKRLLDQGVFSLLFPMVQSAAEAEAAVRACRYPPRGIRGVSLNHRGNGFGLARADYLARGEAETAVLVQIESRVALDAIDEIASVEGVDGVFFGPADWSGYFGLLGQPGHPSVVDAIRGGLDSLRRLGVPAGILVAGSDEARFWLEQGVCFVAGGTDQGLLAQSARSLRAAIGG